MLAVVVLILVKLSAISAQTNIGDSCNDDIGEITLIDDCTTAVVVANISIGEDNWCSNRRMVCCIKSFYLTPNRRPIRKSEEACAEFGPGIKRKVSFADYVQPGDYQHDVAMGYWNYTTDGEIAWGICSGVLISKDYVVTNAHCIITPSFQNKNPPSMIRAGTIDLMGEEDRVKPQDIEILKTIVHPEYSNQAKMNDIALIRLAKPAIFTPHVQPACLYINKDVPAKMIVTGWGRRLETDKGHDDLLLKSTVVAVSMKDCNEIYSAGIRRNLSDSEFCGISGTHICSPASGSAAFITKGDDSRATIVGLTAYGRSRCGSRFPTVYTKISSYLDWIESIVWP